MAKKDFSRATGSMVFDAIREATAADETAPAMQPEEITEVTPEALQTARETRKTQGRKGMKMQRINMAFSPAVHEYISTMSRATGQTITQFTEAVFAQHMAANKEKYDKARELAAMVNE